MPTKRTLTLLWLVLLPVAYFLPSSAQSAHFLVTSAVDAADPSPGDGICGDSSGCTFRAAIDEANALAGPDTITFSAGLPSIFLTLGPVEFLDSGTVTQGNAGETVVDGLLNNYNSSLAKLASGCTIAGMEFRRSRAHGIEIIGAANRIGGDMFSERVIISGCGLDYDSASGIWIHGQGASTNVIANCLIGVTANGGAAAPNPYGITIGTLASGNRIGDSVPTGRNVISGNLCYGVRITGNATANRVLNSVVGCDITGARAVPNGYGGLLIDAGARANRIGGDSIWTRNLISGNNAAGITIQGSESDSNVIAGNLIGLDATGVLPLGNVGAGVLIRDRAHHTLIGDSAIPRSNVITGNAGDGVRIVGVGCDENRIVASFIGVDTSGYAGIGNGLSSGHGVFVGEGASRNAIGSIGDSTGNVISGNWGSGVCLSGGGQNVVVGNCIGVSVGSISSAPNATGVTIRDGSSLNIIGGTAPGAGNVISGNRGALFPLGTGVAILGAGSDHNFVMGNMIGADITGTRALRNGSCGVLIADGAQFNEIGGSAAVQRNVISGNGYGNVNVELGSGVHLFGIGTSHNLIRGNYIGVGIDGNSPILNLGNGVGIYGGATDNIIGGDSLADGNLIVANGAYGVYFADSATRSNTVRWNPIYDNDSMGIIIRRGAQNGVQTPELTRARPDTVYGTSAAFDGTIDIYRAAPDLSGAGEGKVMLGTGRVDSTGHFRVAIIGANIGDTVTAIVTDVTGSTSQFANNIIVQDPLSVDDAGSESNLPTSFALSQNYPNPFNLTTVIEYALPRTAAVELAVYDLLGRKVANLVSGTRQAGIHKVLWSGTDNQGRPAGSGVYFYRLTTGNLLLANKMLLLK
ncbi:hypothetical protein C3F09_09010 [candidate division GN15 bacterium]|uniref:FlgD/Vpr Ig-like domain-containing protein n=1 Tax=candidate division GN15 bacterium TaxID=2072418 RepID=A0A855X113_9BACT|nr:MAG: hypothetical protein C3F09_09010 [candidate division GN15 bacterium]